VSLKTNTSIQEEEKRTPSFSFPLFSFKSISKSRHLWLFLLPGFIIYTVFFALPTLSALFLSTTDWNGLSSQFSFVGFQNFKEILTNDAIFTQSLTNNLKFTIGVLIFQTLLSLGFALLLYKNSAWNTFYRSLFFVPTIISSVSIAFTWNFMYDPNIGGVNLFLSKIGLEHWTQSWIGNGHIAIYSLAFVQFWAHTGQMLIIFVAGIQAIPSELYEAASIDGATRWQKFKRITWPLLAPATTMVVAYTTIQSFKAFDLIIAMTNGGPSNSTEILSTLLYHEAFINFRFGYASAISVVFMIVIALLTFLQFRVLRLTKM
jgi:raffinose/stachyose/melibiose transport system permease protein